ncbi:hypothetical protein LPB86_16370 [Pedobacter sp. MC2016-14]|uniref:hypothetical protein n=1 Tax=Pedobacter sp. MC2016-14 TaxID=2897327 RepID=UPI001E627E0F|nr:hypothetical protein [Pedobacter sp. MC2016-14]MCD0489820.1 hypothetical protein [Pedobacter sp. MC2016-14]
MTRNTKPTEELKQFKDLANKDEELIQKLDEFLVLLDESKLDTENVKQLQYKINGVIDKKINKVVIIEEIKAVSESALDKLAQLDKLEILLNNNYLDSRQTRKISFKDGLLKFIKIIIGFLFVTLGFAMIIMPAPPYFEMFTVFYFNPDDGVTLMDLISLIIIALGIYIIVKSITKFKSYE